MRRQIGNRKLNVGVEGNGEGNRVEIGEKMKGEGRK